MSSASEAPLASQPTMGSPISRAMAARPSGNIRPVASWRLRPQWPSTMMATMASASPPSIQSSALPSRLGTRTPRLEMNTPGRVVRLARPRHVLGDQRVPEEQLQQQRHVAHDFDIDRGQARDQPVLGQPADADEGSQQGGEHDADDGDAQCVEHADQDCAAIRVRRGIGDGRFAYRETGLAVEESETRGDIAHRQVVQCIETRNHATSATTTSATNW